MFSIAIGNWNNMNNVHVFSEDLESQLTPNKWFCTYTHNSSFDNCFTPLFDLLRLKSKLSQPGFQCVSKRLRHPTEGKGMRVRSACASASASANGRRAQHRHRSRSFWKQVSASPTLLLLLLLLLSVFWTLTLLCCCLSVVVVVVVVLITVSLYKIKRFSFDWYLSKLIHFPVWYLSTYNGVITL